MSAGSRYGRTATSGGNAGASVGASDASSHSQVDDSYVPPSAAMNPALAGSSIEP